MLVAHHAAFPSKTQLKQNLTAILHPQATDVDPENVNKSEASQQIDRLKNMSDGSGSSTAPASNTSSSKPTDAAKKSDETLQHPENWTTGGESATGKQAGYIKAMASRAGEDVNVEGMSKTEASEKISDLKKETGM